MQWLRRIDTGVDPILAVATDDGRSSRQSDGLTQDESKGRDDWRAGDGGCTDAAWVGTGNFIRCLQQGSG